MKTLLLFLFPLLAQARLVLKPGVYIDLKPTQALVLDTGAYTFIGLEMRDLGEDIWLDGRKARQVVLRHSRFISSRGQGRAVVASGDLSVRNCVWADFETALSQESAPGTVHRVEVMHSTFRDNGKAISLNRAHPGGTTTYDFTFKCNQFKLTCATQSADACNTEPLRKGLVIGEGVRVRAANGTTFDDNRIGGTDVYNSGNAYPNANEWPVVYGTIREEFPNSSANLQASWSSPNNWKSLENDQSNPIVIYRRYRNEFVTQQLHDGPHIQTFPTNTWVKTIEPANPAPGVTYEPACLNLITDPDPIFPARIAVVTDSTFVTSIDLPESRKGPWLGEAAPNPAQTLTKVSAYIPQTEEMAILQFIEVGTGKVLWARALEERGHLEIAIDLSRFPAGTYGYQVVLKDKKLGAKRFVVVK